MEEIAQAVGRTIRAVRRAQALSLEKLAEQSGLSITYTGEIERGRKDPSLKTLLKIARALRVPLAVLVESLEEAGERISKKDLLALMDPLMKDFYSPNEVTSILASVRRELTG